MKKSLLIFLLFIPACLHAKLQGQALLDSLKQQLSIAKEDTNKVKLLRKLSAACSRVSLDEGIKYAQQSLELASQLKWKGGIANADMELGTFYSNRSDFAGALDYYFKALKIYEEVGNKDGISRDLTNIGGIYSNQENYPKALENFSEALKMCQELGDKDGIADNLANIGKTYHNQRKYALALESDLKAQKIYEEMGNKENLVSVLTNIGALYHSEHKEALALEYAFKSLKINEELGDKRFVAINLGNIGYCYLSIVKDTSIGSEQIRHVGNIGNGNKNANVQKAIEYLTKSIALCKEIGFTDPLMTYTKDMSEADAMAGNYEAALESYKEYDQIKDSVFSNDNEVKIANLSTQRETALKDKQIEINRLSKTKERNERALFIVAIGLLLFIIIVVARNYKAQRRSNKQKEELLLQKDMLMKEIHHRVKNNLQVISTLLDLQLDSVTDEGTREAIIESSTRVRSIALIHHQLYQDEDIKSIDFSRFTNELMGQVSVVFKKQSQNIVMKNNIPEIRFDIDTAIPLGMILNELITNSYKYAFNGVSSGTIDVWLEQAGESYRLIYKDSGPGLSDGYDIKFPKSLGMKLTQSLSKQLGGSFTYLEDSKSFVVIFKDETARKKED